MLYNFQFTGIEHHTPILNIEKKCVSKLKFAYYLFLY